MAGYFVSEGMQMKLLKKKRKEVEELDQVNDDFSDFSLSSPARKIRRLDSHLPPIMEEEEAEFDASLNSASLGHHHHHHQQGEEGGAFMAAQNQLKYGGPVIEELHSENQEKAIVLFKPFNAPIFNSPSNVSVSFHSDLISGFKDQFRRSGHYGLKTSSAEENEAVQNDSNQCKAVVPWVPCQLPPTQPSMEVSQAEAPEELMEAEEMGTATMEVEESTGEQGLADGYGGSGMWTSNGEFPQWQQQHCMIPQPPHNTSTPITWLQ